jgi:hypothetical protein
MRDDDKLMEDVRAAFVKACAHITARLNAPSRRRFRPTNREFALQVCEQIKREMEAA